MKIGIITTVAILFSLTASVLRADEDAAKPADASQAAKPRKKMTPEHQKELIRRVNMRRYGGYVRRENSAKGVFVVLNAQDRVSAKELDSFFAMLDKDIHFQTAMKQASGPVTAENAKAAISAAGGAVGVALVSNPSAPSLLVAPENGWAIVNVAALAIDNPSAQILASRTRKEAMRALAFITGGAYMSRGDYVMRDVANLSDLDGLARESYGFDMLARLEEGSNHYGIRPWQQATYLKACEAGWAPAPTNEYQKAIWDKVHALPTAPIKIKPETKKVAE